MYSIPDRSPNVIHPTPSPTSAAFLGASASTIAGSAEKVDKMDRDVKAGATTNSSAPGLSAMDVSTIDMSVAPKEPGNKVRFAVYTMFTPLRPLAHLVC